MIIWWGTFICMAGAGTIVFHYGIQKAKRKSLRSMKSDEKICEARIFCYSGMLEASGYILCGKIPEQKSYSKLEFETGLDGSKS